MAIVETAVTVGESVSDLLNEMKALAVSAQDYALTDPARAAINDSYLSLRKQIDTAVANASFNGANLLSAGGTDRVRALANTKATSTIDVEHFDLSTGGPALAGLPTDLLAGLGAGGIDAINAGISAVNGAVS